MSNNQISEALKSAAIAGAFQEGENESPELIGGLIAGAVGKSLLKRLRRSPRVRRPRVARGRGYSRAINPGFRGRGTLRTSTGRVQFRLPKSLVTKSELKKSLDLVGNDVRKNAKAILKMSGGLKKLDRNYKNILQKLAKQATQTSNQLSAIQSQQLFNSLLPPKIKEIEFESIEVPVNIEWDTERLKEFWRQSLSTDSDTDSNDVSNTNLSAINLTSEQEERLDQLIDDITRFAPPYKATVVVPGKRTIKNTGYDTTTNLILSMLSGKGGMGSAGLLPALLLQNQNNSSDNNTALILAATMLNK